MGNKETGKQPESLVDEVTKVFGLDKVESERLSSFQLAHSHKRALLSLSCVLDESTSGFLKKFAVFLREGFSKLDFGEIPAPNIEFDNLMCFFESLYDSHCLRMRTGSALIGKTPFDKLELIRSFFKTHKFEEAIGRQKTGRGYVIIDCNKRARSTSSFYKLVIKYSKLPFVVFQNCENLLCNYDVVTFFKNITSDQDSDRNLAIAPDTLYTNSWYIFLAEKDTRPVLLNKADEYEKQNIKYRLNIFRQAVKFLDWDLKEEQYF